MATAVLHVSLPTDLPETRAGQIRHQTIENNFPETIKASAVTVIVVLTEVPTYRWLMQVLRCL